MDVDAEARADGLELEEHEEAVLEPRDAVGVPLAVAALLGAPAPGSISLVSSMGLVLVGCRLAGWLAGGVCRVGIGVIRWPWPTRSSKFEAACRRNGFCEQRSTGLGFSYVWCGVSVCGRQARQI